MAHAVHPGKAIFPEVLGERRKATTRKCGTLDVQQTESCCSIQADGCRVTPAFKTYISTSSAREPAVLAYHCRELEVTASLCREPAVLAYHCRELEVTASLCREPAVLAYHCRELEVTASLCREPAVLAYHQVPCNRMEGEDLKVVASKVDRLDLGKTKLSVRTSRKTKS
jgi:hypothetical protein